MGRNPFICRLKKFILSKTRVWSNSTSATPLCILQSLLTESTSALFGAKGGQSLLTETISLALLVAKRRVQSLLTETISLALICGCDGLEQ